MLSKPLFWVEIPPPNIEQAMRSQRPVQKKKYMKKDILLFYFFFIGEVMVHLKLYILYFISSCVNLYYHIQDEVMVMTLFIKGLEVEQP